MSNLAAAAKALKQKGPKKKYNVMFEQQSTNCITVDAIDEDDAKEKAWEVLNGGGGSWDSGDTDIVNTEEV